MHTLPSLPTQNHATLVARCHTLDEVRIRIDQADRQLVTLMAERAQYVAQAAQFKHHSDDVAAPQRAQQVIAHAVQRARELGAPTDVIEATYRAMIDAFVAHEHTLVNGR